MKLAPFILLLSFISHTVLAQLAGDSIFSKSRDYQITPAPRMNAGPQISLITPRNYRFTMPNGNKVHQLKQDNMPCIVPQNQHFNMPVLRPAIKNFEMDVFKQGSASN